MHEDHEFEFKQSSPLDDLQYKIVASALAMANLPGGGTIVIGIEEGDAEFRAIGVSPEHKDTYEQDTIAARVNAYASSRVVIQVSVHPIDQSRELVIIDVAPSIELPVLCTRDGPNNLRAGALYIRPLGEATTRPVRTAEEMRLVLERFIEQRAIALAAQARRVNPDITPPRDVRRAESARRFDQELGDL